VEAGCQSSPQLADFTTAAETQELVDAFLQLDGTVLVSVTDYDIKTLGIDVGG